MLKLNYRKVSESIKKKYKVEYNPTYLKKVHDGKLRSLKALKMIDAVKGECYDVDFKVIANSVYAEFGVWYRPYYLSSIYRGKRSSKELFEFMHIIIDNY